MAKAGLGARVKREDATFQRKLRLGLQCRAKGVAEELPATGGRGGRGAAERAGRLGPGVLPLGRQAVGQPIEGEEEADSCAYQEGSCGNLASWWESEAIAAPDLGPGWVRARP